jgi:hypothetical protein
MADPFVVSSSQGIVGADPSSVNTYSPSAGGLVGAGGRLAAAGLPPGGSLAASSGFDQSTINFSGGSTATDWRVRISCPAIDYSGVQAPLAATNGVVFPYTPQISVVHQANYTAQRFTHSNYPHYAYENSEVQAIQVTGEFTAQNYLEAQYVLACIYFFRAATKMFFGKSENAGNPPPLVFLNGYGTYYLPRVPCAVTQFSHTMPPDIDYIDAGGSRIPTSSQMSIILQPMYSKKRIAESWSLSSFASGGLINGGFL